MKRYFRIWWQLTHVSFATNVATVFSSILFLAGKILRFVFMLIFLLGIVNAAGGIAGYNRIQSIFFYLTFNLIDILAQLFLRGVYLFRQKVVSGEFDYYLIKPVNPLFRALGGNADLLDLITLIPLMIYMGRLVSEMRIGWLDIMLFLFMLMMGFLLSLSFHILVAALGVVTTEVDNAIMFYRDLTAMGRVPVDIYATPIREILTFIIPVAVMITFPAKALMGLLSMEWILFSLFMVFCFLFFSLRFWKYALSQYSSASS